MKIFVQKSVTNLKRARLMIKYFVKHSTILVKKTLNITPMKNLILTSLLIVSFTVSAQFIENRSFNLKHVLKFTPAKVVDMSSNFFNSIVEVEEEEEDAPFDFDIKKYLPKGFNPFGIVQITYNQLTNLFTDEEEIAFDFDHKEYLPANFNPYVNQTLLEAHNELNQEEDVAFEFDTKDYLPAGFNPYINTKALEKRENLMQEKDATFDFNTRNYLPEHFVSQRTP